MRTLIYTCCDEKYSHFIPLFCAALLWSNENIDIEIGVSNKSLTENEEKALTFLRKEYPNSKILIKYNMFDVDYNKPNIVQATYNQKEMMINTVRFVSEPIIKDTYTYISDIDIINFDKNFYDIHIKNMNENNTFYSNVVRPNSFRMTGLHFVKTAEYYPVNINDIELNKLDEQVLYDIMNKTKYICNSLCIRPVHGIHMSPSRNDPAGIDGLGWGARRYKDEWNKFKESKIYKNILFSFDSLIIELIKKLENYYNSLNDNK